MVKKKQNKSKKSGFWNELLSVFAIIGYVAIRWKLLNHIDDNKDRW